LLRELESKVTYLSIEGLKGEYLLLSSQVTPLLDTKIAKIPVINVLPVLDPYIMGYKIRQRYLDPDIYDFVFDRSGNGTSTIIIKGQIGGIWDFTEPDIKLFLFEKEDVKKVFKQIRAKTMEVGRFISGIDVQFKMCQSMRSLRQRSAGGFMSPLKFCEHAL
jgi:hypothetical protein